MQRLLIRRGATAGDEVVAGPSVSLSDDSSPLLEPGYLEQFFLADLLPLLMQTLVELEPANVLMSHGVDGRSLPHLCTIAVSPVLSHTRGRSLSHTTVGALETHVS